MAEPKKISVKKAIKAPVKKNMPSMDAQPPKMTEKVTSKKEESCCGV